MKVPRLLFTSKTHKGGDMTKLLDTLLNFYDWINQAIIKLKKGPVQKVKRGEELNFSHRELYDLVNKLNNEQIVYLLEIIFYNRPTEVFLGSHKGVQRSVDLDEEVSVCLNGTMIQINTESPFVEESNE